MRHPDRDTDNFNIVAGVLQGDTLALYLFFICLDNVLRTSIDKMKDNVFKLQRKEEEDTLHKKIKDAEYADELALLANTAAQAKTLLECLERPAAGIGLHVNAGYMCFNQSCYISTLNGSSLKLVDQFPHLGSSVSSSETDISTWLAKT